MSNEPVKMCILGAAFNTANMGVSVLAAGALRCVLHRFPQARVMQLDYERKGYDFQFGYDGRPVEVRFLNIRFSKKIYLPNNIAVLISLAIISKLIPWNSLRHRFLSSNACLKELLETDVVFSLAGGDSFSDIYGLRRLLYTSLPQILTVLAGRRLVLLPQTIGPFRHRVSKAIARYILTNAERIYSRDRIGEKATQDLLGPSGRPGKVKFCYDLGFDVDPVKPSATTVVGLPAEREGDSVVVGFNVSGLLMMGGYNHSNMFGLKAAYDAVVSRLIEFLISKRSATVLLIPHVFGSGNESDSSACEIIFEKLRNKYQGKIGLVRGAGNYGEIKHVIGQCDFFVGARMHACIGALSQNIPAISIAYSDKFIGVMETIGFQDLVVDPRKLDEDEIVRAVDEVFARRALVRQALEETMPMVKEAIHSVLLDLEVPGTGGTESAAGTASEEARSLPGLRAV
jgi:colanic acid/amylovoran biosynthesis protein